MSEKEKDSGSVSYVSLVADPFGYKTLEVAEAQQNPEGDVIEDEIEMATGELDMQDITEGDAQLDQLAKVMEEQTEKSAAEAAQEIAEWTPDAANAEAEQLAKEIAEDQALAAQLAAEDEAAAAHDPELLAAMPSQDVEEIQSCLEALLFMFDKPVSLNKLQEMLGPDFAPELFEQAMEALMVRYQSPAHGFEVVKVANGYQFRTKPGRAALAKKLAKVQTQRLSTGAMETLAIVAYKQPVMKEDIDKIRGVDSSYFVRGLLDRKLIEISGRSDLPGRPMMYKTTNEFLSLFGLADLMAMPSLRELEQMIPSSQTANPDDEDPRVREMRRLVGQMKSDNSTQLKYDPREDDKILQEIREKVQAIPTSTPYLDEQKAAEKLAAKGGATVAATPAEDAPIQPGLAPTVEAEAVIAEEAVIVEAAAEEVSAEIPTQ